MAQALFQTVYTIQAVYDGPHGVWYHFSCLQLAPGLRDEVYAESRDWPLEEDARRGGGFFVRKAPEREQEGLAERAEEEEEEEEEESAPDQADQGPEAEVEEESAPDQADQGPEAEAEDCVRVELLSGRTSVFSSLEGRSTCFRFRLLH